MCFFFFSGRSSRNKPTRPQNWRQPLKNAHRARSRAPKRMKRCQKFACSEANFSLIHVLHCIECDDVRSRKEKKKKKHNEQLCVSQKRNNVNRKRQPKPKQRSKKKKKRGYCVYNKRETTDRPEEVHSLQLRVVLKLFAPKLHLFLHASEVVLLSSLLQVARIVQQSVRRRTRRRGAV